MVTRSALLSAKSMIFALRFCDHCDQLASATSHRTLVRPWTEPPSQQS